MNRLFRKAVVVLLAATAMTVLPATAQRAKSYDVCLSPAEYLRLYGAEAAPGACAAWPEPSPAELEMAICRAAGPDTWKLELKGSAAAGGPTSFELAAVRLRASLPITFSTELQGAGEVGLHIYTLIDLELGAEEIDPTRRSEVLAGEPRIERLTKIDGRCEAAQLTPAATLLALPAWVEGPQSRRDK
ncbi:MAG TPA: hypothetical protein PK264_01315 [Hyphomicrobiaceae bacterium]|nr:hypothetical protein [Hyphomicrobiaceae bacterium]